MKQYMIFKKKNRSEQNESNYQKWLKTYIPTTTNQKIELVRIWTDRYDNNFYILKNPGHLTRERSQRIEESLLAIEYGVSKDEIENKLNSLLAEIKEMPWQNMTRDKLRQFVETSTNDIGDMLFRMKRIKLDDMLIQAALYFFYIDGEINTKDREIIKGELEKTDGVVRVLVASYGTVGTGYSIKNLHYLIMADSFKSEQIVIQAIGRVLRLFDGKKTAIIFDLVDVLNSEKMDNITYKHFLERKKFYENRKYPYTEIKMNLNP